MTDSFTDQIEPAASVSNLPDKTDVIWLSIAISLKRIADVAEIMSDPVKMRARVQQATEAVAAVAAATVRKSP